MAQLQTALDLAGARVRRGTIRDDLIETVAQTINRPEAPEYILLEASGVADPSSIAMTFVDPEMRDRIRLDSITCVVDADQVFAHPENPAVEQLKLRQIAFADMMILNKADLAGPEQVKKARAWIDEHFSRLRIVRDQLLRRAAGNFTVGRAFRSHSVGP